MGKFGKKSLKRFFLNLSIIRLQFTNFEKHFDNKSCQPISGNDKNVIKEYFLNKNCIFELWQLKESYQIETVSS